jgi:hypothetical protein
MKSILVTYPNFRLLPKGLKQLLLASESFFFEEATSPPRREARQYFTPGPDGKRFPEAPWLRLTCAGSKPVTRALLYPSRAVRNRHRAH